MHVAWMAAGLDPGRFWVLTFGEMDREMRAAKMRFEREDRERVILAYYTANLVGVAMSGGKLPSLESLLKPAGEKRRKTDEEMMQTAKRMFIALGGKPEELENL